MNNPGTNAAISIADEIENIIFETVVVGVEVYCKAQLPFLNLPIISQLFNFFVEKISGLLKSQLENFVAFTVIDIQTGTENSNYKNAINKLQQAAATGTQDDMQKAKDNFKSTLQSLIRWDGATG